MSKNDNLKISKAAAREKILRNGIVLFIIIVGFVAAIFILIYGIGRFNDSSGNSYYEQKLSIEEIEDSDPLRFLSSDGTYTESFWGTELIINGQVNNTATVSDYKDVTIRVTFYSKTNSVIATSEFVLYEIFQPNTSTPFKHKIKNNKDISTIGWEIISALPVN